MKKTEYFTGVNHNVNSLETAIKTATDKRDTFIKDNKDIIAKIDCEDIIITMTQNQNLIPVIKLTYFPK